MDEFLLSERKNLENDRRRFSKFQINREAIPPYANNDIKSVINEYKNSEIKSNIEYGNHIKPRFADLGTDENNVKPEKGFPPVHLTQLAQSVKPIMYRKKHSERTITKVMF
nr:uncharacterized protein LOC118680030 [Bactrocera oleae]